MIHQLVNVTITGEDGEASQHNAIVTAEDQIDAIGQVDRYLNMLVSFKTDGITGVFVEGVNMDGDALNATVSTQNVTEEQARAFMRDAHTTALTAIA